MKYSNEIDLFESIDQDVSSELRDPISSDPPVGCTLWVLFYSLFSGVQTQAYRPVDLVPFTESRVREILAQVNKRQSKGKLCSMFIVTAVLTIKIVIFWWRTVSDILSSICIKRVGFSNYLKNAGRLLSQISFLDPKPENMPQTNSRQVHESKCFKLCKCNFVQNVLVINFKYMLHSQCCHQRRCSENYWKLSSMACFFFWRES